MRYTVSFLLILLCLLMTNISLSEGEPVIVGFAWSHDEQYIAIGYLSGKIEIWDATSNQIIFSLIGHTDYVNDLIWSSDDTLLASGSFDNTIRIWNISSQTQEHIFMEGFPDDIEWGKNNDIIVATFAFDSIIIGWEVQEGSEFSRMRGTLFDIDWRDDFDVLAMSVGNGEILFVNENLNYQPSLPLSFLTNDNIGSATILEWVVDNSGADLIIAGFTSGRVQIWAYPSGDLLFEQLTGFSASRENFDVLQHPISDISFSKDSHRLSIVTTGGMFYEWDISTSELIQQLDLNFSSFGGAFSHDGTQLVYADQNGAVQIIPISSHNTR